MIAALVIVGIFLVLTIGIALLLHSWGLTESRIEDRLHDQRTHTVAVAIPNGVDPVVVKTAVVEAGFTSVIDSHGDAEYLLVECNESDRGRLRRVVEAVHVTSYDGSLQTFGDVVFEDER